MIKKRDHHYVFQAYLKRWADVNEKIWCIRDGKIFNVKTRNIAFEKDFYRISSLSDKEIEFINLFFREASDSFKKELRRFISLYTTFDQNERIFHTLCSFFPSDSPEIDSAKNEIYSILDVARNNIMEDTYAELEGEACVWLESLCDKNLDFFYNSNDNQNEKFISFVCTQYFRTKRMKEITLNTLKQAEEYFINDQFPKGSIKADNLYQPMLWLISSRCADAILKAHLKLLINMTSLPFITSDQPVINTKADYTDLSKDSTELVFYYPVSPHVAILLNDSSTDISEEITDETNIREYNNLLSKASYNMLFSNNEDVLKEYIKS